MSNVKKVVLAYSGGLDTSIIIPWLKEHYGGAEVIAFCGDVGQGDDYEAVTAKALKTGASKCIVRDLREEFVRDYCYKALSAGAIYEDRYLLGTALARPLLAYHQVQVALEEGADALSHGATGKGNDQVRFDLLANGETFLTGTADESGEGLERLTALEYTIEGYGVSLDIDAELRGGGDDDPIVQAAERLRRALSTRTGGQVDVSVRVDPSLLGGVIAKVGDLISVRHCVRSDTPDNVVRAVLGEGLPVPSRLLERNLIVTSACGICGERTVESLSKEGCERVPIEEDAFRPEAIRRALASLEESQAWFRHTGGTHGAALFDEAGELLLHREDVGRHNALDKLVGAWLRDASTSGFVVVSSRASFELVQKTVRAGFPMIVAVGAASSLAVEMARRFDLTLVGFARESRFNVYSNGERIALEANEPTFVQVEAG